MRLIVTDTGPLLHLEQAGLVDLLPWVGEIHCPPKVLAELKLRGGPDFAPPVWLHVDPLTTDGVRQAERWIMAGVIDAGEAEALALFPEIHADLFLTDDLAARELATSLKIPVRGSIGVVLLACVRMGKTSTEAKTALDALFENSTLWTSKRVRLAAFEAVTQLFDAT